MEYPIKEAQQWSQKNYNTFKKYKGQWVAYNAADGIIAHDKELQVVESQANTSGKWFVLKYVHPLTYAGLRRLASVHFRPLHTDTWVPNAVVIHRSGGKELQACR
jgi:Family of unknown function (DUF5678)